MIARCVVFALAVVLFYAAFTNATSVKAVTRVNGEQVEIEGVDVGGVTGVCDCDNTSKSSARVSQFVGTSDRQKCWKRHWRVLPAST